MRNTQTQGEERKRFFIDKLRPLLDSVSQSRRLYVPKPVGERYTFALYDPATAPSPQFNNIRAFTTAKEFLFPLRERVTASPQRGDPDRVEPFAVFGFKDCDLRSMAVLDQVFLEEDFRDPFYEGRRRNMFVIASDCFDPAESCCCTLFGGEPYPGSGFDLSLSQIKDGFIVEIGSEAGARFVADNAVLFVQASETQLAEQSDRRAQTRQRLEAINAPYEVGFAVNDLLEKSGDTDAFDVEAQECVECQACTRICPTCHCFYLYDAVREDYFAKMKMWDSCLRMSYAAVAGGANPRKAVGDRIRHRLMHKFSFFFDRYGIGMCIGCGRCIEGDTHGMDIRVVLKKLDGERKGSNRAEVVS